MKEVVRNYNENPSKSFLLIPDSVTADPTLQLHTFNSVLEANLGFLAYF